MSIDYSLLEVDASNIIREYIYYMSSSTEQVEFLNKNVVNLFQHHIPLKTKTPTLRRQPWFTHQIRTLMHQRDLFYNRWKRFRIDEFRHMYCSLRNKVVIEIRKTKSLYFSSRLSTSLSGRQLWENLRNVGIGKANFKLPDDIDHFSLNRQFTSLPTAPRLKNTVPSSTNQLPITSGPSFGFRTVDCADVVESLLSIKSNAVGLDEVHPVFLKLILPILLPYVTHIFNTILTTGTYPSQWKLAKILPIPKNAKCDDYRPISILQFLSKVFERILQKQMSVHLSNTNLLTPKQSGFRKKT